MEGLSFAPPWATKFYETGERMKPRTKLRLEDRRLALLRTLDHIRSEQREVESNTEWMDLRAQRRRCELLSELCSWYRRRLERIDGALGRNPALDDPRPGSGLQA